MEVDEEQALKDVVSQVFHVILGKITIPKWF